MNFSFKHYLMYLPLAFLLMLIVLKSTLSFFNSKRHEAISGNPIDTRACQVFCKGFLNCTMRVLGKRPQDISQEQTESFQSKCYAGCTKQGKHILACMEFVKNENCSQAALCLQSVLQGKPPPKH